MHDDEEEYGFHRFVLSWDTLGVELVFDIDAEESKRVEAALKGEVYRYQDPSSLLDKTLLRARFNSHRNYEVFAINMPSHLSEDGVRAMFDENFDEMTKLVRKKGLKLH